MKRIGRTDYASEADLVAAFCASIGRRSAWTPYHETEGWDVLMVHASGIQVGIEAKLSLNAKVLEQALPGRWTSQIGPDYRAVLVARTGLQNHLSTLAHHLGIVVISDSGGDRRWFHPTLPDESFYYGDWPNWCPAQRCPLPEYVPDVTGGKASPLQLSPWKIKAIKLLILLERRGAVSRADMKFLEISPTRWTDHCAGYLSPSPAGYVRNGLTPDLKTQHPKAWAEIEADFAKWSVGLPPHQPVLGAVA